MHPEPAAAAAPAASTAAAETPVALGAAVRLCGLTEPALLAMQAALVLLQAGLPVLGMFAMQWFVDAVVQGLGPDAGGAAWAAVVRAVALAAGVALAGTVVRGLGAVFAEHQGRRLADRLAQAVAAHAAAVPFGAYDEPGFHDQLHRALGEAGQRPVRLLQDLGGLLTAGLGLVFVTAVLAGVEPWLPLAVGLAAWPIHRAARRHARLRFEWQRDHVAMQREVGYLGGVLTGGATASEMRQGDAAAWLLTRLAGLRTRLRASLRRLATGRARDELLVHTLASAAVFGAFLYLGHTALLGGLTLGGLVLQVQAVQRTQNAVRDGLGALAALAEDRLFLRPLAQFLALPVAGPGRADRAQDGIAAAFTDVAFTYAGSASPAIAGATVRIARGEFVAVVGPNGGGKSTLLKLLAGRYAPTRGSLALAPGSRAFLLPQHANVLELSVRDNVAFGRACSDQAVHAALAAVGLSALVAGLDHGLDTVLSRRVAGGAAWSGGQLRRLLLARALVGDEPLLLLDEPFAQLDDAGAEALLAALAQRRGTQTVVVADHDPRVGRFADRILRIDSGRLVVDAPAR